MKKKNKEADIVIEIVHIFPKIPSVYLEHPTRSRSRNAIYGNFLNGAYSKEQAEAIKRGVDAGLVGSQLLEISDPDLSPELIRMATDIACSINDADAYDDDDDDDLEDAGIWAR